MYYLGKIPYTDIDVVPRFVRHDEGPVDYDIIYRVYGPIEELRGKCIGQERREMRLRAPTEEEQIAFRVQPHISANGVLYAYCTDWWPLPEYEHYFIDPPKFI